MPPALVATAALAITGAALVCGALTLVATRRPALALGIFLTCCSPPGCCA